MTVRSSGTTREEFVRRLLITTGVVVLAAGLATMFVLASDIFFLIFLALLLAILLRSASNALARRSGMSPGLSLVLVIGLLVLLAIGAGVAAGAMVASQFERLTTDLPQALDHTRNYLQERDWGRQVLSHTPSTTNLVTGGPGNATSRITSFFSTTFGILGNVLVLVFLTIYLAANPAMYRAGLIRLVPPQYRPRAEQVVHAVGYHLRWWLIGRLLAMLAVGVITGVGLWIVGLPQFLILALVAALLTAIPFIGPIIAAIPGVLLGLMQGPTVALWALLVYVLAQAIENYLLTPLIQEKTVELPPVLTIAAVTLVGVLFGILGLIVATPLAVTVMVLVKMLYVEDTLGDRMPLRSDDSDNSRK